MKFEPHPQPRKAAFFGVLLVLVVGFGGYGVYHYEANIVPTPSVVAVTQTPKTSVTGTVYYSDGKMIKALNLATGVSTNLVAGTSPSVSHNHRYFTYYVDSTIDSSLGNNRDVYLYTIATKQSTLLKSDEVLSGYVSWSTGDSFVALDGGTSPDRGNYIVNVSGKLVGAVSNNPMWLDDTHVVSEQDNTQFTMPETESPLSDLAIFDTTTGKTLVLKQADATDDYWVTAAQNGSIYFAKDTVKDPSHWLAADSTSLAVSTYWSMSAVGTLEHQQSAITETKEAAFADSIIGMLPSTYQSESSGQKTYSA